jgi:P27 family predicted phage terminase small subunit
MVVKKLRAKLPSPPTGLGKHGKALWLRVVGEYDISDEGGKTLLLLACQSYDRVEQCRETIAKDGMTVSTPSGLKDHPLLKHEENARGFVVRTLGRLGLDIEPPKAVGRPAKQSWPFA